MRKKPKPSTGRGKARAAALNAEIDKLTHGERPPAADEPSEKTGEKKAPPSPREFIQRWMAEHDKKGEEK